MRHSITLAQPNKCQYNRSFVPAGSSVRALPGERAQGGRRAEAAPLRRRPPRTRLPHAIPQTGQKCSQYWLLRLNNENMCHILDTNFILCLQVEMAHKVLSTDMSELVHSMKLVQKYLGTTVEAEYRK